MYIGSSSSRKDRFRRIDIVGKGQSDGQVRGAILALGRSTISQFWLPVMQNQILNKEGCSSPKVVHKYPQNGFRQLPNTWF
jgi:hypothetical protein